MVHQLFARVMGGERIGREEALGLVDAPLDGLTLAADSLRRHFCGWDFDLCTIINAKSGRCSENCRFCAQSSHYPTTCLSYPLLDEDTMMAQAKGDHEAGVLRFSIVTAGRSLDDDEIARLAHCAHRIVEEIGIAVCVSAGLLTRAQYKVLKDAGVSRIHNNLEAAEAYFPQICTTHTYADKVAAIKNAQAVGLTVCSGGIMGLGESWENRIDMALALRDLGIKSVPVNVLNAIPGTPLAENPPLSEDEVKRIVAIYRFILHDASIRMAGGRGLFADKGRAFFSSGANAAISGDMLTTYGINTATDLDMLRTMGYKAVKCHD